MKKILIAASLLLRASTGYANEEITVGLRGAAKMEMVWIEPGTFMMGTPDSTSDAGSAPPPVMFNPGDLILRPVPWAERPQHQVTISNGFYVGKYEITQGQWKAVMGKKPWKGQYSLRDNPNYPAVQISKKDVHDFIYRMNSVVGADVFRLPTEAECEYACRAGSTTRWAFGDNREQLPEYAWYEDNNHPNGPKEVGTKKPNPWGLYDVCGNVWELIEDSFLPYAGESQVDPKILLETAGLLSMVRGGSWGSVARATRSACRTCVCTDWGRDNTVGARLVRVGPIPPTPVPPQE